jgi:hypothetical protein
MLVASDIRIEKDMLAAEMQGRLSEYFTSR